MMATGVGAMGLSLDDFLDLAPSQFLRIMKEWSDHEEVKEKSRWEQSRYMAFAMVSPYLEKKKRHTPQSVFPLPWDKKPAPAKPSTRERFEEVKRKWR
jgi:hypothetical protein